MVCEARSIQDVDPDVLFGCRDENLLGGSRWVHTYKLQQSQEYEHIMINHPEGICSLDRYLSLHLADMSDIFIPLILSYRFTHFVDVLHV